jgi:hypothetical protein
VGRLDLDVDAPGDQDPAGDALGDNRGVERELPLAAVEDLVVKVLLVGPLHGAAAAADGEAEQGDREAAERAVHGASTTQRNPTWAARALASSRDREVVLTLPKKSWAEPPRTTRRLIAASEIGSVAGRVA